MAVFGIETEKVRSGCYRTNIHCQCGGTVYIERNGYGNWRWESWCDECKQCDPNGWPSLFSAVMKAPEFFNHAVVVEPKQE
jgi:hypothetical protein